MLLSVAESVTLSVDTNGSAFDTVLYVLDGCLLGAEVACNDDGGEPIMPIHPDSPNGRASTLRFEAVAGHLYAVVVDGFNGTAGAFVLTIRAE